MHYQNSNDFQHENTNTKYNKTLDNKYNERAVNNSQPSKKDSSTKTKHEPDIMFEIFGIKLCSDDILLICLIFFLYNEGVKDEFLFIALILLLLS